MSENEPERPASIQSARASQPTYATDRASLERDCDLQFFRGTGPGGQNRNKVETAVRLTHRPSGVVVTAEEHRTQGANREAAYKRMAERLEALMYVPPTRTPTKPSAASKERRLEAKRRSGEIKRLRSTRVDE